MTDPIVVKVSELTELTDVATGDLLTVVDITEGDVSKKTKKVQAGNLKLFNAAQITDGIVGTTKLVDGAVTNAKLANRVTPVTLIVLTKDDFWTVGDGKLIWPVPEELNGATLTNVQAECETRGTGTLTVSLERGRRASPTAARTFSDMLSTNLSIDSGEYNSKDATVQRVINASYASVQSYDVIRVNIDAAGTGAKGLSVLLGLTL